jgi:hypothetical protein
MDITLTSYTDTEAILNINTSATDTRVPTHFVILLDLSESMNENNKLGNVKQCMSLLLDFLTPADSFSLLTFADESEIVIKEMSATPINIAAVRDSILSLHTDGCTNLSAGLLEMSRFITESGLKTQKTGVLLLTDGLANRGETTTPSLQHIVQLIREKHPSMSLTSLAYGNNHNVEIMKLIATEFQTSYNIVETIEDTAAAIGDSLGGFLSTVYQNVTIHLPPDAKVFGSYKQHGTVVRVGDLLSNSKTSILLQIPRASSVTVKGCELPSLDSICHSVTAVDAAPGRHIDFELLGLRYECSRLLQIESADLLANHDNIEAFVTAITDTVFDGHPVAEMLRNEIPIIRSMASRNVNASQLSQHAAFVGLGRGITRNITVGDPRNESAVTSPYQNNFQRHLTTSLREASGR